MHEEEVTLTYLCILCHVSCVAYFAVNVTLCQRHVCTVYKRESYVHRY